MSASSRPEFDLMTNNPRSDEATDDLSVPYKPLDFTTDVCIFAVMDHARS